MAAFQANPRYLFERTRESLGRLYGMHWPYWQPSTARGVRRTPLYERLAAANAAFGEAGGWERAAWFAPEGEEPSYRYAFGRQNWFEPVREECLAAVDESCEEAAFFLSRLPPDELEQALTPEPLPADTLELLASLWQRRAR